jgi:hypothetical protein
MAKMRATLIIPSGCEKYSLLLGIVGFSDFPTQREMASFARGRSKRASAMTRKVIALEFVFPTVLAIALGFLLSVGAVHLTDKYLVPVDQAEAYHAEAFLPSGAR